MHYLEYGAREGRDPNPLFEKLHNKPTISIVIPVYNIDEIFLHRCIHSVLNQIYNKWEMLLVDDRSTNTYIKPALEKYAEQDKRVKVRFLQENQGTAVASNKGASLATGEFIGFLDHDDELTKDALYEVVRAINENDAHVIYSDEDLINGRGTYLNAFFKPNFSQDLLFTHNYITHFVVVKKSLFDEVGGFFSRYDGAQDYDLILRLTEKTNKIYHIPKVLYHWRTADTSTSADPEVKGYADDAGKLALDAVLDRRKIKGNISKTDKRFYYRVKREIVGHPLISIIISVNNESEYLKLCIEAILNKTSYQNFEIICIKNSSVKSGISEVMTNLQKADKRVKFYEYNITYNYSKITNYAVGLAVGEHIILMNNDVEIINSDWIESLLEHSQREDVGAVGARLYYPNAISQNVRTILDIADFSGHSHRHFPCCAAAYANELTCIQNVSIFSGALLMVKKRLYEEIGGLDENNFAVALNDIDFCLMLRKKGYVNVYTPYCEANHYESILEGYKETLEERARFRREKLYFKWKWDGLLDDGDPYFNPNLYHNIKDYPYGDKRLIN